MTTTVILINPMGADITLLVSALLQGTILQPGDSLYTLPYNNNAGAANIAGGVTLLDDKLTATSGNILVVGYSEGCQVVVKWLRDHGVSSPIAPTSRLKFLLIANAARKYGGVLYGHATFSDYADTTGLPAVVHYQVTDFCRQYDGFADFPTGATDIQTALDAVDDPTGNTGVFDTIQTLFTELAADGDKAVALENAYAGMSLIHDNYFGVTVDDPANITYTDSLSPNVTYVWAPTYPVPMLGMSTLFSDQTYRKIVERFYNRPVTIPLPDYAGGVQVWSKPTPVTGWWPDPTESPTQTHLTAAPMRAAASMPVPKRVTTSQALFAFALPARLGQGSGTLHAPMMLAAASMPAPVIAVSTAGTVAVTVIPSVAAAGHLALQGSAAVTVTPSVAAAGAAVGGAAVAVTPSVTAAGYGSGSAAVTVTPSVTATGAVVGLGTVAVTVTPSVTATGQITTFVGSAPVTVTPNVTAAGRAVGSSAVTITPNAAVSGYLSLSGTSAVTVTPSVTAAGALVTTSASYDALGAGYLAASNTGTTTPSWSHTNGGNGAVVFVDLFCSSSSPTMSATFGGTAMNPGPSVAYLSTGGFFAYVLSFYLLSAPSGSQTVALSFSAGAQYDVVANSMTYNNVTGFASGGTNFDSTGSTNPSLSASSAAGQMVANAFGGYTATFSAYNQSTRWNQPLGAASLAFIMGDALGAGSVAFSASGSGWPWGGTALVVQ